MDKRSGHTKKNEFLQDGWLPTKPKDAMTRLSKYKCRQAGIRVWGPENGHSRNLDAQPWNTLKISRISISIHKDACLFALPLLYIVRLVKFLITIIHALWSIMAKVKLV